MLLIIFFFLSPVLASCTLYQGDYAYREPAIIRGDDSTRSAAKESSEQETSANGYAVAQPCETDGREEPSAGLFANEPDPGGEKTSGNGECVDKAERKAEAQEAIDEALVLLNQSREFWERGELDSALALLDQAYALTLDINDDPDITWQRDDLRFLIAKRIIEIYASRSTAAVGSQSEIPLSDVPEVNREIERFQKREREFFLRSYRRSGAYRDMILQRLREAGLPEELSWLPLVESGFIVKAFSSARALGLWQFIPSTGYKFGLKRDQYVDERMNPELSTDAAIAYLTELHGIFGDWQTVLAAYNCGEGRVLRVISGQQVNYLDNFWDLYRELPPETRRYVPKFLAALRIIKEPEKYGFDLASEELDEPLACETVTIEKSMRLADIAKYLDVEVCELESLNVELRLKVTPNRPYELKIPPGKGETLLATLDDIPAAPAAAVESGSVVRHRVQRGESLSTIASRYGSSIRLIAGANNIARPYLIRVGQWLHVPVSGSSPVSRTVLSKPARHRVQRGESLSTVAVRYGSSVGAIARANNIARPYLIRAGQVLTIPAGTGTAASGSAKVITYNVQRGDSLFHLARRYNTTVSRIKTENNLEGNLIRVGQKLLIPTPATSATAAASTGNAPETYVVRGGDSPYTIARRFNVSLHSLLEINGLSPDDTIYPGQTIILKE
ncbi:MAG: hypothetical protein AVO39_05325 [delta proteobacterium MLS_D]|jgi:membrane-bound lytic murein transglycosylase D|nr:MAG: hypothetical protein AVO39_05325 [delta proteobacterium MLS_D]